LSPPVKDNLNPFEPIVMSGWSGLRPWSFKGSARGRRRTESLAQPLARRPFYAPGSSGL